MDTMTLNQQLLEVAYATRDAWQKLIDRLTEEEKDIIPLTKEAEKAMKKKDRKGKYGLHRI